MGVSEIKEGTKQSERDGVKDREREAGRTDTFSLLYIYDPRGIYCKVSPISPCDCLDLLELYQYSDRDTVKGTTSICSESHCWLWIRAGPGFESVWLYATFSM